MVLPLIGGLLGPMLFGGAMSPLLAGALGSGIGAFAQTGDIEDALTAGLTGVIGGSLLNSTGLGGVLGGGAAQAANQAATQAGTQLAGQAAGQAAGQGVQAALNPLATNPGMLAGGAAAIDPAATGIMGAAEPASRGFLGNLFGGGGAGVQAPYQVGSIGQSIGVGPESPEMLQRALDSRMTPGYMAGVAGAASIPPPVDEPEERDRSQAPSPGFAEYTAPTGGGLIETDYGVPTNYPAPDDILNSGPGRSSMGGGLETLGAEMGMEEIPGFPNGIPGFPDGPPDTMNLSKVPDYSAYMPDLGLSEEELIAMGIDPYDYLPVMGRGFAEGGSIAGIGSIEAPQEAHARIIMEAEAAIRGQHPDPEVALGEFLATFGEVALRDLVDRVEGENPAEGLIEGEGDGMSDDVPAMTADGEPIALSGQEFIVPADVVGDLGNGDPEAGSQHLYEMFDRVREARRGAPVAPERIDAQEMLPA